VERSCEPMNKNRIEGAAEQGERAKNREALVIKAKRRKSGGCAAKERVLTWGDPALRRKGRRWQAGARSQQRPTGRKFLGYELWRRADDRIQCAVARKALASFKQRIREITCCSGGRRLAQVVERLRAYMPGWKAYFQLAQTSKVFRELDEWLRHRLRALQLKHWRRGTTMYRELKALGASEADARRVVANSRCWWRNSRQAMNRAMPIAYFDRLGVLRLS